MDMLRLLDKPDFIDLNGGVNNERDLKYSCPYCSRIYVSEGSLQAHMQIHSTNILPTNEYHPILKQEPYEGSNSNVNANLNSNICHICNRKLSSKQSLENHVRKHNDERIWACTSCVKSFVSKEALKYHVTTQHEKKKFACHMCNHQLVTKQSLNFHLSKHLGIKPFSCDRCSRTFTTKHAMKHHMKKCKI